MAISEADKWLALEKFGTTLEFTLEGADQVLGIDATPRIMHSFSAEVTDHPVEAGGNITDHVRPRALSLTLDGVMTDYPSQATKQPNVGAIANYYSDVGTKRFNGRSVAVSSLFQRLQNEGVLITVNTKLKRYADMVLQEFTCTADASTHHAIRFTLTFKQVKFVQSQETKVARVSALVRKAQPKVELGDKAPAPSDKVVETKTKEKRLGVQLYEEAKKLAARAKAGSL